MSIVGIDIGTNEICAAKIGENNNVIFKKSKDAFFRIKPKSTVNRNAIKMTLDKNSTN